MRINKYLADKQIASRRQADKLIEAKRVLINGKLAKLGDDVKESDTVTVKKDSKEIGHLYFAYNKPVGVLTHSAKGADMDIGKMIKGKTDGAKVFPLGRLDKDSHGLIILTNDGRITGKLLDPEEGHEKEYIVEIESKVTPDFTKALEKGVVIKEEYSKVTYRTKPCLVTILSAKKFSITLTEGKKRQVRRMVEALRHTVKDLQRIRVMNIALKNQPENTVRRIKGAELEQFLSELGMK
ncbi:MAG: pseudouridine synthase [Candidatus Paceibacterota bacterium]|jgi:23S rRNA pseudouridine2604 synthase